MVCKHAYVFDCFASRAAFDCFERDLEAVCALVLPVARALSTFGLVRTTGAYNLLAFFGVPCALLFVHSPERFSREGGIITAEPGRSPRLYRRSFVVGAAGVVFVRGDSLRYLSIGISG